MRYALLDTNVYIDSWTGRLPSENLADIRRTLIVRQSSVVLSELRRGARTRGAVRLVDSLKRVFPDAWAPTEEDWWIAGALVRDIGDRQHWETAKRREFQNDALIALTAKRHGAAVVTRNESDFELLSKATAVRLVIV